MLSKALIAALIGAALLPVAAAQAQNRWREPKAINIAHQGGEDEFPSNTLYAFREALKAGADMLELDVGVTKDNKVIVMHDTTVDGKTNGRGNVSSLTLRQIKKLDAAYWFAPRADEHYSHELPRRAYRFRGIATGKRKPPEGLPRIRLPRADARRGHAGVPAHADQRGDQGPHARRGDRRVRPERRGARRPLEEDEAQGPDRRLLPAGGGRSLPRARSAHRPRARHRGRLGLDPGRRLAGSRRGGVPGADHLRRQRSADRHHDEGERRARTRAGLCLAELVLERRPRLRRRAGAGSSTCASTAS